jgi:hypothetical protein
MTQVLYPLASPPDPVAAALAPWKVEDYLNATDYSDDPNYVPSDFALEFVTFIKLVNGAQGEENKTPVVHYRMLDTITDGGRRIINLCHRGIAKTTVMAEYLFLYIAVYGELPGFGKVDLALYVSDSIENGVKNMRKNLEFRYENSDFLRSGCLKAQLHRHPLGVQERRWQGVHRQGLRRQDRCARSQGDGQAAAAGGAR